MLQLTFNPGLTLTCFRTTRPWSKKKVKYQDWWLPCHRRPRAAGRRGLWAAGPLGHWAVAGRRPAF